MTCSAAEDRQEDIKSHCCNCARSSVCLKIDSKILDEAAVVQMLQPKLTKSFDEYLDNILFLRYSLRNLKSASRVDTVSDVYRYERLKANKRESRWCGVGRRVLPSAL